MPSDYRGDQPPQYQPRPSHGPYQGPERRPGHSGGPGSPDYSGYPGNFDNTGASDGPSAAGYPPGSPAYPGSPSTPQARHEQTSPQNWESRKRPASPSEPQTPQRPRWLIPAIVAALVVVVIGGVIGVLYAIGQNALREPINTATSFCNDLKAQKYADAYTLLSPDYQAHVTGKDFTQMSQLHDQLDGKVRQCGLAGLPGSGGLNLNLNPESASLDVQITRNRSYSGAVTLVKQNGSWKIDAIADSAQGSDVGALTTGALFCQDLASQKYADIYAMFTPAYQQQIGSAESYVKGLQAVFGGGQYRITGCQPQINTYTVTAQGDSASYSGAFDIRVTTDAGAQTVQVPFKMAFAKISGSWKISDLEVVQSQG